MALTKQKENFVQDVINMSNELLSTQKAIQLLDARWNQNTFSGITLEELQEKAEFSHLTPDKLAGAITALNAVDTALGDDSSGQATNLIKMKG